MGVRSSIEVNRMDGQVIRRGELVEAGMNATLWTMQVLWGVFFALNGFGKMLCYNQARWNQALHSQPVWLFGVKFVPWFSGVPQGLFVFIGVCEFLGGVGLILPAITRIKPKLTPYAAVGLTLVMIFAAVFHITRDEYVFLPINVLLGAGAAFIAYGRLVVRPIGRPTTASAIRTGVS